MKKPVVLCLFLLCILLCACHPSAPVKEASESLTSETTTETVAETVAETEAPDTLAQIRQSLSQEFSFVVDEMYMDLASDGFSQTICQDSSSDGSFHFRMDFHQWDYLSDYDVTDIKDFYYQYEDNSMVCYAKFNEDAPTRMLMTKNDEADLNATKDQLVGAQALVPDYLTDFADAGRDENGLQCFTYRLPLSDILSDNTLLSSYISNVCAFFCYTYLSSDDLSVYVTVCTDDSMRPVSVTHDFSELKPYVLSEGALSGEAAFETDLMHLTYTFDYDLPQSVPVPESFVPAA